MHNSYVLIQIVEHRNTQIQYMPLFPSGRKTILLSHPSTVTARTRRAGLSAVGAYSPLKHGRKREKKERKSERTNEATKKRKNE